MLDNLKTARNKVRDLIRDAWQFPGDSPVFIGRPMIPIATYPYAVIRTPQVPMEWTGVRNVTETYEFEVAGFFIPGGTDILDDVRADKAKALGEALMAANWNDLGCYQPFVPMVQFPADDLDTNDPYEIILTFVVLSDRSE
jgi:hypothetical protein